jgi:hypothetical protein
VDVILKGRYTWEGSRVTSCLNVEDSKASWEGETAGKLMLTTVDFSFLLSFFDGTEV